MMTYFYTIWITGAVTLFTWLVVTRWFNRDPEKRKRYRDSTDGPFFPMALFASSIWPVIFVIDVFFLKKIKKDSDVIS